MGARNSNGQLALLGRATPLQVIVEETKSNILAIWPRVKCNSAKEEIACFSKPSLNSSALPTILPWTPQEIRYASASRSLESQKVQHACSCRPEGAQNPLQFASPSTFLPSLRAAPVAAASSLQTIRARENVQPIRAELLQFSLQGNHCILQGQHTCLSGLAG